MSFYDDLKLFISAAEKYLAPFIRQFLTGIGPIVLAAAEKAVITFAAQQMPGADKKAGAYQQIVTDLQAQGITAAASIINGAIEAAVAGLKSEAPPA